MRMRQSVAEFSVGAPPRSLGVWSLRALSALAPPRGLPLQLDDPLDARIRALGHGSPLLRGPGQLSAIPGRSPRRQVRGGAGVTETG